MKNSEGMTSGSAWVATKFIQNTKNFAFSLITSPSKMVDNKTQNPMHFMQPIFRISMHLSE